jgi:hypothetical protein
MDREERERDMYRINRNNKEKKEAKKRKDYYYRYINYKF